MIELEPDSKKSKVWKHFARRKGGTSALIEDECVICHKVMKNASNMTLRYHLKAKHGLEDADSQALAQNFSRKKTGRELKEAKCLICFKHFRVSVSTQRYHLKNVHGIEVENSWKNK